MVLQISSNNDAKKSYKRHIKVTGSSTENEKIMLRETLNTILENSTAMPFRRYGNKYRCFYCNTSFSEATNLRDHTAEHENVNKSKCVKKNVTQLLVKLDIIGLQCKICYQSINEFDDLISHLGEHNMILNKSVLQYIICFKLSDGDIKCLFCNETFAFFGPLLLHTHRKHKCREFICETCGIGFGSKGAVDRHSQSVHPTSTYQCRYCEKKFFAVHRRDNHEKRIHNVHERKCHICGDVLGSIYKKDTHLAIAHNIWSSEFKCDICPKKFRYKHLLLSHNRRIHLKEKKIVCDVCGDRFFDHRLLKLHMARHSDLKPFECGTCQKRFPRKCGLVIHTRIHTNDRRYKCKLCEKAFVQFASLKLHTKTHHNSNSNYVNKKK
ncbi:zinc finger protein 667-like [Galleria mellonella]|uniref:Zinc finger protein 667-like n=1 Tax=Galleria mellonella TaxID=7137 RepID=A0A6J3C654_GALME|nr:zinc finger protein 667-like [Galleria mellonella]